MSTESSTSERDLAAQLAARNFEQVAVGVLRAYGDELLGYLLARLRNPDQAREVFSMFAEDLWLGLPGLTLRTTLRAYCYALARNAAHRFLQRDLKRQRRGVPLSAALSLAVAGARTETAGHLQTENKNGIALLRERLSEDERELLTLRIDRGLSWSEVVEALGDVEGDAHVAVARQRKRFQVIKQKLALWAREAGIVRDEE